MNNIYCSTILLNGLEKAIDKETRIFDKNKLSLPFGSNKNYIWYSQINSDILDLLLIENEVQQINRNNRLGLKINNNIFLNKSFDSQYFPIIFCKRDFLEENKIEDIGILIFDEFDYKIPNIDYLNEFQHITPSKVKLKNVLGIKRYTNLDKIIFKDISSNYFH